MNEESFSSPTPSENRVSGSVSRDRGRARERPPPPTPPPATKPGAHGSPVSRGPTTAPVPRSATAGRCLRQIEAGVTDPLQALFRLAVEAPGDESAEGGRGVRRQSLEIRGFLEHRGREHR